MHLHLQAPVLPDIEVNIFIGGPCITVGEVLDLENHRFLVKLAQLRVLGIDHPAESRGQDIIDRYLAAILLDAHRSDLERCVGRFGNGNPFSSLHEGEVVFSPLGPHQVEFGKPHYHRFTEVLHKHPDEPYRFEITYHTDLLLVFGHRDLELVPLHRRLFPVRKRGVVGYLIDNIV